MSLQNAMTLFASVGKETEAKLADHFQKVEQARKIRGAIPVLYQHALIDAVSLSLRLSTAECRNAVNLYLQQREDLTVKNSAIWRVVDLAPSAKKTPEDCAMKHYPRVKEVAGRIIKETFERRQLLLSGTKHEVRLSIRELKEAVATELGIKKYAAYYCLHAYFQEECERLVVEPSKGGGIRMRDLNVQPEVQS